MKRSITPNVGNSGALFVFVGDCVMTPYRHDVATSNLCWPLILSGPIRSSYHVNLKIIGRKPRPKEPKTHFWRHNVATSMFLVYNIQWPYNIFLPCQFEADWTKSTPGRAKKRKKTHWWRHNVMVSWRNFLLPWFFMFPIELSTISANKNRLSTHSERMPYLWQVEPDYSSEP